MIARTMLPSQRVVRPAALPRSTDRPRLAIAWGRQLTERARCRIEYAFRVFCAVYGYGIAPSDAARYDARVCYGCPPRGPTDLELAAGYRARDPGTPVAAPTAKAVDGGELPCFHLTAQGAVDWLGEVFEWLSAADELAVGGRDAVGRIPWADSVHGRYQLSPATPYAAVAMRGLNRVLQPVLGEAWQPVPERPWNGASRHVLAATHDVDYLPLSTCAHLGRLLKNVAIALATQDWRLAASIAAASAWGACRGALPLQALAAVRAREQAAGIGATYNILCRQAHRRDANYAIRDRRTQAALTQLLSPRLPTDREGEAPAEPRVGPGSAGAWPSRPDIPWTTQEPRTDAGFELGVHGSYTSLETPGRLAEEYETLRGAGYQPIGGRQHWLRYQGPELFQALCAAGALYDCTVGYSAQLGFRTGACFPYPPYDFAHERPFPLLELPMVLMDGAVYARHRAADAARAEARQVLHAVREFGWGGVSLLWHDTAFDGGQYPRWLGDLYWDLKEAGDAWRSCADVVRMVWPRYAAVGLLPAAPGLTGEPFSAQMP